MVSCGQCFFGILITLTVAVFVAQIVFGAMYFHEPIACEHCDLFIKLTLAGGCSGILAVVFISCCCHGSGFGLRSSNPDRNGRLIYY
ncbi:unnamed protein product [Adineta steineri]|uniref:Uncharacterized protein n=1 Tax=Adineta steineri TaxID=433720 RepID=A0A820I8E4_9BILA|nr:unnamed protein product [Adineta steineri]